MTRVAIYARTSADKTQTVENHLRQLTEVGVRLGWTVVAIHADEGVSGTQGRDRRPGFDAVLRGVARREFDLIAVWSICRLGRSLQDLVGFLAEVQARGVGLYRHTQALDSTTPAGRALFGMIAVFREFERAMIRNRVLADLERTKAKGTRLGRPPLDPVKAEAVRSLLAAGAGIRKAARKAGVGASTVQRMHAAVIVPPESGDDHRRGVTTVRRSSSGPSTTFSPSGSVPPSLARRSHHGAATAHALHVLAPTLSMRVAVGSHVPDLAKIEVCSMQSCHQSDERYMPRVG